MHPILFEIGALQIPTYGVLLAISFLIALRVGLAYSRREGLDPEPIMNLWLWVLLTGVLGAKVTLYLTDLEYYLRNPAAFLGSLRSAGVFYGGVIAGAATGVAYVRRRGLPVWKCLDLSAPPLALANSIGRLGCLAAGCCYGRPTALAWGITFRDPQARSITGVPLDLPLHPTQVLLSLAAFLVFLALVWLYQRKEFDGEVFAVYLALETTSRFLLEFLRGDPRGRILWLPTSQFLALAGLAAAIVIYVYRRRRTRVL
jgi:phosphatidylglycerol:prolipoprotein diacylglycerol transferase